MAYLITHGLHSLSECTAEDYRDIANVWYDLRGVHPDEFTVWTVSGKEIRFTWTPLEKELAILREHNAHIRYPWDTWTQGQIWMAVKEQDFTSTLNAFQIGLHLCAQRKELIAASKKVLVDSMLFQFTPAPVEVVA